MRRGDLWSLRLLGRLLRALLVLLGVGALVLLALCFTQVPYRLYYRLSADAEVLSGPPTHIVVLGGGGIPSKSGLVRAYHGAEMARVFTGAQVIVALPAEDGGGEAEEMRQELVMRGVPSERVVLEDRGRNTREQAMGVATLLGMPPGDAEVLLVTSPEHMRRSLLTFRKLGFTHIAASAVFDESVDTAVTYQDRELGGGGLFPRMGMSVMLRYQLWTNMSYLIDAAREACALAYYRHRGWI